MTYTRLLQLALLWMAFIIPLGAATIKVSGLPAEKSEELMAKISPRLDYIKTREATSWRADDASFFLKRLLIRAGHADATVSWELPGNNTIQLIAQPGTRYRFGDIRANQLGPMTQEELTNYFLQPIVDTELVKADKAPYIEEYTAKGVSNVENYLKSLGYWHARVNLVRNARNRGGRKMDITLSISPGAKFKLSAPRFRSTTSADVSIITSIFNPYVGKTAHTVHITEIRNKVEKYYRNNGYHNSKISMSFVHRSGLTTLIFSVAKGRLLTVDDVHVQGQTITKKRRIRRYFDALVDSPFNEGAADQSLKRLLATGAFRSASYIAVPLEGGRMDLQVQVIEADARSMKTYFGVGSFEGFILGSAYTDHNLFGRLLRLDARAEYSGRGLLGEISVTEPQFAGEDLQLTVRGYILQRLYDGYDKKEAGVEGSLTWKPRKEFTSRLYLGASHVTSSSTSLTAMELGPESYLHTRIGFEQTLDWRDNPLLPSKGLYLKGSLQYGHITGDASTSYLMANFDGSYRLPIAEKHGLHARFSTGIIQTGESQDFPIDLRLFSGGSDSVRSFDQRELGPRSLSNDALGGEAYWNASLEYLHSINDPIKGLIFFDMGQVYANAGDLSFNNPSYAIGAGLRLDLPIGPVRLEYGYNLNRQKGEPSGTLHFSIGTSF